MIARSITQKNIENIIAVLFNQTLSHDSVSSSLISDRRKAEDFPRLLFLQAPGCLCATFFSEIYTKIKGLGEDFSSPRLLFYHFKTIIRLFAVTEGGLNLFDVCYNYD